MTLYTVYRHQHGCLKSPQRRTGCFERRIAENRGSFEPIERSLRVDEKRVDLRVVEPFCHRLRKSHGDC